MRRVPLFVVASTVLFGGVATAALLVSFSAVLTGCVFGCDHAGCVGGDLPAVVIEVVPANDVGYPPDLAGTLELVGADGSGRTVLIDCPTAFNTGMIYECFSNTQIIVYDRDEVVREVRFLLEAADGTQVAGTAGVAFRSSYPNGKGCEPVCRTARLRVELE